MVEKECYFDLKNYPAKLTASKHIVFKSLTNTIEIFSDIRSPFLRLKLLPEELKVTPKLTEDNDRKFQ